MKKGRKISLIIAAVLIVLGILVSGFGFWGMGFNFRELNTEDLVSTSFEITEPFREISVEVETADLYFAVAEDGVCRVECVDYADEVYAVDVEDGKLCIIKNAGRIWYKNVGLFSMGETYVTVYLPDENYTVLQIHGNTGDIEIPAEFSFEQAVIGASTGDVCWRAQVQEALTITTDTGDVEVRSTSVRDLSLETDTGDISVSDMWDVQQILIETDTGKVELNNTDCTNISADSNTGDIALKNIIAGGLFAIKSDTGDVVFDRSDAAEIFVQTNTGDVTGTLASDKVYLTETDTGDVDVPKTIGGGRCEITTSTGDIRLRVEQ